MRCSHQTYSICLHSRIIVSISPVISMCSFHWAPVLYYFDRRHLRVPSSNMLHRPVLQPTPVLPIYAPRRSVQVYAEQHHLPVIRDHMVKANLSQRATLKCKSPAPNRPDSSLSRSTTAGVTSALQHAKAFNPLKVVYLFLVTCWTSSSTSSSIRWFFPLRKKREQSVVSILSCVRCLHHEFAYCHLIICNLSLSLFPFQLQPYDLICIAYGCECTTQRSSTAPTETLIYSTGYW